MLQMFFKIGVLNSFPNFTAMHLCWGLFLKSLQAECLQLYLKKSSTQVFSCEVCEIFNNTFFYRTPPVAASALLVAASVFFQKKLLNSYCYFATLLWRSNSFSSRHIVWGIKSRTCLFINLSSIIRFSK